MQNKNNPFVKIFDENGIDNFPKSGVYSQPFKDRRTRRNEERILGKCANTKNERSRNAIFKLLTTSAAKIPFIGKFGFWSRERNTFFTGRNASRN